MSGIVLYGVIVAAGRAPYVELWGWQRWQNMMPIVGMLVVCWIVAMSFGRTNPFSFGGSRDATFDPSKAGLVKWVRHPILASLLIWSSTHMFPNGNLAHLLFFGIMGCFAGVGMLQIDLRRRKEMGATRWLSLLTEVRNQPRLFPGMSAMEIILRSAIGVAVYTVLFFGHAIVIGVSPYI